MTAAAMKLSTRLLGELTVPVAEGLFENFTLPLGGKNVAFDLYIFENFLNERTAEIVARCIDGIPLMYDKARAEISERANGDLVDGFVREGIGEMDEDYLLGLFKVDSREEIARESFLAALELRGLHIWQDREGEVGCVLDFSLDKEYTDELLVVSFDQALDVTNVSHES
jgi:hypothetical protein